MIKTDSTVETLILDENGEPVDIVEEVPTMGGDVRVVWKDGVIDPVLDYEGFKAQLEAWHRKHNPHLFVGE